MVAAAAAPRKTHRAKGDANERQPRFIGRGLSSSYAEFNVRITEQNRPQ